MRAVAEAAFEKIMGQLQGRRGRRLSQNGWIFTTKTGIYGTDYLQRALVTAIGLGANRPQDAVYPTSEADAEGQALHRREQVRACASRRASCRRSTASGR